MIVVAATITYPLQLHAEEALFKAGVANMSDELYPALIHRVNTLPLACQARSITAALVSPKTDVQYSEDHRLLTLPRNLLLKRYLHACSLDASLCGPAVLLYTTVLFILLRYCPIRFKMVSLFFMYVFYMLFAEKYYKPIRVHSSM